MPFTEFPIPTALFSEVPLENFPSDLQLALANNWALHFDHTLAQHVNCGIFWAKAYAAAGVFFWEAWINAEAGAEYIISDGYGGAHNLLWGLLGIDATAGGPLGGNVSFEANGPSTISFESIDNIYAGDWHHVAVGFDGLNIRTYINGICSSITPAAGVRQTTGDNSEGMLGLGGSDHSNFNGYIRSIRGFEGFIPWTLETPFIPQHGFYGALTGTGSTPIIGAVFIADFSRPANPVADISSGYTNGIRQVVTNTVVITAVTAGNAKCVVTAAGMSNSPKTVTFALAGSETAAQVATKARTALRADADVKSFFSVGGLTVDIVLAALKPAANDATMNVTIEDVTSGGITDDTTAVATTAGVLGERIQHPGSLMALRDAYETGSFPAGIDLYTFSQYQDIPEFRPVTFTKPSIYRGTPASIPGGAVGYDDFSRVDVTYAWDNVLELGITRTGQTWTNAVQKWGIMDGCAYADNSSGVPAVAVFDLGKLTQDVTINRKIALPAYTGMGAVARYTDPDNYIFINHIIPASEFLGVYERVAGVNTAIIAFTVTSANSNNFRITVSGSTVTLYANGSGTPLATGTTTLLTGTKVGIRTDQTMARINSITAY